MSHDFPTQEDHATKALAQSLLHEYLYGQTPTRTPRPLARHSGPAQTWTKPVVLAAIVTFYRQTGGWPTGNQWRMGNRLGLPSRHTVALYFRSLEAATEAAQATLTQEVPHAHKG